ncbi:NAD(+) synthase [Candidatus Woesearchaeota archaeon]|nr:NAD(+) synthase [Candidatus Woesearchaeota archaeon]
MNSKQTIIKIVKEIRFFFKKNKADKAIIGISGGVDSAVTCKLCILALGKEKVIGVLMPEIGLTKQENINDARDFCEKEEIKYLLQPINKMLISYQFNVPINKLAYMNLKARIRANILYSYANTFSEKFDPKNTNNNKQKSNVQVLVVGTGNKTEAMMGYGTKYGDLACDLFVIGDLFKKEVYEIANYLKIPESIINKIPTAELYEGQTDEKEMGITYKELDKQLMSGKLSKRIKERVLANEHKRKYPHIIKVH